MTHPGTTSSYAANAGFHDGIDIANGFSPQRRTQRVRESADYIARELDGREIALEAQLFPDVTAPRWFFYRN